MWPGVKRYEEARVMVAARPSLSRKIGSRRKRRKTSEAEFLGSEDDADALQDQVAHAMDEDLAALTNAENEQLLIDVLIEGHHQYVDQRAEAKRGNEELQIEDQQSDDSDVADQLFGRFRRGAPRPAPRPRRTVSAAAVAPPGAAAASGAPAQS